MKKIVIIGGGTGSFAILNGLKKLKDVHLTAVVPATDSGGSTGRLVDEFGYLPPGDVRQCLVALANESEQPVLRKLFTYRFDERSKDLKGHHFGNLLLTALRDIYGNEIEALEAAEELFNINGKVYRSADKLCNLVAEYEDGSKLIGEHHIDEPPFPHDGRLRINKLYTDPSQETYIQVSNAIKEADLVILGPGDFYSSLLANIVIKGIPEAIQKSKGKFVYIMNLVTRFGQTYGFNAKDFIEEVEKYVLRKPDYILINNAELPEDILVRYKLKNSHPIENNLDNLKSNVIETDLLASEQIVTAKGDTLDRSLIRHDGDKVAEVIGKLLS